MGEGENKLRQREHCSAELPLIRFNTPFGFFTVFPLAGWTVCQWVERERKNIVILAWLCLVVSSERWLLELLLVSGLLRVQYSAQRTHFWPNILTYKLNFSFFSCFFLPFVYVSVQELRAISHKNRALFYLIPLICAL